MVMVLVALSFACAALLAVFIPVKRIRTSIPGLAIVLWLTCYNIIHGVNALVWAGNVDIHIPVWCDIVTKFMLGAHIALPGALVCISRQLELVSSSRTIHSHPRVARNRAILELFLCYVVPIMYMSLHIVVQDHRFDLVRDFGCSASTHPSTFAFLLLWIPPLIICSIALSYTGMSLHNSGKSRLSSFRTHLESRCSMTSSLFYRRLATCMSLTGSLTLISLSALFSIHNFQSWTSWDSVHASMGTVEVVQVEDDVKVIQFTWWSMFAISALYILFSFIIGEEARDSYRWVHEQLTRERKIPKLVLPFHSKKSPTPEKVSRSSSLTNSKLRPLTIEFKSGWDDALDEKKTRRMFSPRSSKNLSASFCSSPTGSHRSIITDEDQAFMESTISYLGSPTAKALGIAAPLQVPSAAFSPPQRNGFEIPPKPSSPPPPVPNSKPKSILKATPKSVPVDGEPTITSVLDAKWPKPPASPTPSLPLSHHGSVRSRSHSPASSAEEMIGYPLHSTITPPHLRTRPFEDSSVSSSPEVLPSHTNVSAKRRAIRRPSIRTLHRSWSKERISLGSSSTNVIHMAVVQETV